jgi:hypothetical protein
MVKEREPANWNIIETFQSGEAIAEVSMLDGYQPRYSMRVGWRSGEKSGAWFQYREDSQHAEDVFVVVRDAEQFILERIGEHLEKAQTDLDSLRAKQAERKKRYQDNVEKRKEENRNRAKGGKGKG